MLISFLEFELDRVRFQLRRSGLPLHVEPRVLEVLLYLAESSGRVVTKQELIDRVWDGTIVSESALSRCIMEARKAIGDSDRESPVIRTVHGRGYRFEMAPAAPAVSVVSVVPAVTSAAEIAAPHTPQPAGKRRSWIIGAITVAIIVLTAIAIPRWAITDTAGPSRLAILPIAVESDDRELHLVAISIGDLLEERLSRIPALVVRGPDYTRDASLNAGSLAQVADELGSDSILSGTLRRGHGGGKAQLVIALHQVHENGRVRETPLGHYDIPLLRKSADISRYAHVRDRIVEQITATLAPAFSDGPQDNLTPRNVEAYRIYLQARQRLGDGACNSEGSLDLMRHSLDLDPRFAPAWEAYGWAQYGLASSCAVNRDGYKLALEAADQALKLVPNYASAIGLKASVFAETGRIEEAYAMLTAAETRDPRAADLQSFLFYVLGYSGYNVEAQKHLAKLQEIDPNFLTARGWTPNPYLYTGDTDRFLEALPATETPLFDFYRGLALVAAGRNVEARQRLESAFGQYPNDTFARMAGALVAIIDGRAADARQTLGELVRQRIAVTSTDGEMRYKIAQLFALAGDPQAALREFRAAVEEGFFNVPYMEKDPLIATLRADPQFAPILAKARIRHEEFGRRFRLQR